MDSGKHTTLRTVLLLAAAGLLAVGCETSHYRPAAPDGGGTGTDADAFAPTLLDMLPIPDGLPFDSEGPTITIKAPSAGDIVVDDLLRVEATVADPDGVDPTSVILTLPGKQPTTMTRVAASTNDFEALVDVSSLSGEVYLWIAATDILGHQNSKLVQFTRDPGPVITFLAPTAGGSFKGSLLVEVTVADPEPLQSFTLLVGKDTVKVTKKTISPTKALYTGTLDFDAFTPPLSGKQVLTATAANTNGAETEEQRIFYVDDEGPTITVKSQSEGQIIAGTIDLEAEVTDPAGVLPSSVKCVIGDGASAKTVQLKATLNAKNTYTGQFDTRTFDQDQLWPVMSFRAEDVLGNESHRDIQVGLDNGAPIIELDPSSKVYIGRYMLGVLECSHPFDPVGNDAANDLTLVPQIVPLRARVEDQGNFAASARFTPVAAVEDTSVWMYVSDDTQKPLVVDSTGDGYCDSVNPELVPLGSQPQQGKAIAVNLGAVPVDGEGNFTYWAGSLPAGCTPGTALAPPKPLCTVTTLTKAIFYSADPTTPAVYAIPPALAGDQVQCMGLPFDFKANGISKGWTCVAVEAADKAGNVGVSPPLRLYYEPAAVGQGPLPAGAGSPPTCTGTYNPTTKKSSPGSCKFRGPFQGFPQTYPDTSLLIEKASQGGMGT